jgi:hypothetical protein
MLVPMNSTVCREKYVTGDDVLTTGMQPVQMIADSKAELM